MLRPFLSLAALSLAVPTIAQTTAAPQPSAVRANDQAAASVDARQDAQAAVTLDAQAQYQGDLAAYDAALAHHDANIDRQAEHYRHQQRAYADAMRDWRAQDYACRHGHNRACTAPAPDPANYY